VSEDRLPDLEATIVEKASAETTSATRRSLARALMSLDPAGAQQRHEREVADRNVQVRSLPDGMASLTAVLRGVDAEAIYTRLSSAARLLPKGDLRTIDQRRADLLVDGVLSGISHDALPNEQGSRACVNIHVTLSTLLGQDEDPGHLDSHGPVTAAETRRIAHEQGATWRRLVDDPLTGELLERGRTTYRPPKALAAHVLARDGECAFPSCRQPG
jgi:hypothetical protein